MIYQVFDIDGTLGQENFESDDDVCLLSIQCFPKVLKYIQSLDLFKNKLIFLTARYMVDFENTVQWLKTQLMHDEFTLYCRSPFYQYSIPSYKRTTIMQLLTENPEELHFYDDSLDNLSNISRFRKQMKKTLKTRIFLYNAFKGNLLSMDKDRELVI